MPTKLKDIPLGGLSTSPSDYRCDDGELAIAIGLHHTDGAIRNSSHRAPSVVAGSLGSDQVLYQHVGNDFHHLIRTVNLDAQGQCHYAWQNLGDEGEPVEFTALFQKSVTEIASVGNTLIFYTADEVFYYRWTDGHYLELGSNLPEPLLSFSLAAHPYRALEDMHGASLDDTTTDAFHSFNYYADHLTTFFSEAFSPIYTDTIPDKAREDVTNAVFADVNYFQGKWCSEHGYFSQPFLLRYAFRLFDGSLTKHSAPILLLPSMGTNPTVYVMAWEGNNDSGDAFGNSKVEACIDTVGVAASLCYRINNEVEKLTQWRDIIQGVEIFVSAPIYTYDASKRCEHLSCSIYSATSRNLFYQKSEGISTCAHNTNEAFDDSLIDSIETLLARLSAERRFGIGRESQVAGMSYKHYADGLVDRIGSGVASYKSGNYKFSFRHGETTETFTGYAPAYSIIIPERPTTSIVNDIRDCSNFYHVLSIPFDEILDGKVTTGEWHDAKIEDGVLGSLVAREAMTDDYDSHHTLIPSGATAYNNRLNIFGIEKRFFDGFGIEESYQRTFRQADTPYFADFYTFVFCNDNATQVLCRQHSEVNLDFDAPVGFFYYPDPTAKRVVQFGVRRDGAVYKRSFSLREHVGLNGAVRFDNYGGGSTSWQLSDRGDLENYLENERGESSVNHPNVLYTSEANNPFAFRAANSEQIGNGSIIAMVPAARPLSQGQFGEFPMYAFTSEGVWALYPNETGGWSSKQPISRDVVLSREAILQLDQSVIFATHRGLMEISGSNVNCISEEFDGPDDIFADTYATHLNHLVQNNTDLPVFTSQPSLAAPSFRDTIGHGIYIYDYRNQRIIIGHPDLTFAYVYNMKDKFWTSMPVRITRAINSYPLAYAMIVGPVSQEQPSLAADSVPAAAVHGDNNLLVDFSASSGSAAAIGTPLDGFLLSRPIKLDEPDAMKTIRRILARGHMARTSIDLVLYGSRDLSNWVIIGDARGNELVNRHGTGYKYFRVGIISRLSASESISGLTIEYETRQTNKPR